jgi:hypothetical protein
MISTRIGNCGRGGRLLDKIARSMFLYPDFSHYLSPGAEIQEYLAAVARTR